MGPGIETLHDRPIRVRRGVIGLLSRGDEYLMIRRADNVPKPGTWCFPGGHVEPGETPRKAVQRELLEELGITVHPTRRLGTIRVHDSRHILVVWCVSHVRGEFALASKEIADVRWVMRDQIATIRPGLPSNDLVLEMLRAGGKELNSLERGRRDSNPQPPA